MKSKKRIEIVHLLSLSIESKFEAAGLGTSN